jgi:hypothetical protein
MLLLQVCRLFDLFLATHPLMPLYVGAVAMHSQRSQLLAAEEMPMLHSRLVNLAITKRATADELAMQVKHVLRCCWMFPYVFIWSYNHMQLQMRRLWISSVCKDLCWYLLCCWVLLVVKYASKVVGCR